MCSIINQVIDVGEYDAHTKHFLLNLGILHRDLIIRALEDLFKNLHFYGAQYKILLYIKIEYLLILELMRCDL